MRTSVLQGELKEGKLVMPETKLKRKQLIATNVCR